MISFVYLDVGGVALLDFSGTSKWNEVCAELGIPPDKYAAMDEVWVSHIPELCTTRNVETMLPILSEKFDIRVPSDYSLLNAIVRRFTTNPSIWPVVDEMKRVVPVGLLTNMYVGMYDAIQKAHLLPDIRWGAVIDSSIENCQKPETRIFELAQARVGAPVGQMLFVENSIEHVEAAKNLGWQTFLYDHTNPEQSSADLAKFFQAARLA